MPSLYIIDDEPDTVRSVIGPLRTLGIETQIDHPEDVYAIPENIDVVLVDYRLDDWGPRNDVESWARKPSNGLALIGNIRSNTDLLRSNIAYGLYSANLTEFAELDVTRINPADIARQLGLEWVFEKVNTLTFGPQRIQAEASFRAIASFVKAINDLGESWPDRDQSAPDQWLTSYLALPEEVNWWAIAWRQIIRSSPPLNRLGEASHGLNIVRWLLHRIMPYPTFLWSKEYVAARLGITPESVSIEVSQNSDLGQGLKSCLYQGACGDMESRWWKAGIDALVSDYTVDSPGDRDRLKRAISSKASESLEFVESNFVVATLNEDLNPEGRAIPVDEATRISPDDWPQYADQAWASNASIENSDVLTTLIDFRDRNLLDDE